MAHLQVVDDTPDSFWCPSLGPFAQHGAHWRCVLDDGHAGPHRSAGDPTWSTEDETGRVVQGELASGY